MTENYTQTAIGIILTIVGYILKTAIDKIKNLEQIVNDNKMKIEIMKQEHSNLNSKFEQVHDLMKEISKEVKDIAITLATKKDKD